MWRSDFLNIKITEKRILVAILVLAAVLRFWGLGTAEFYHDEGFTAFRSIGYLDYIQDDDQTTPVQWFKDQAVLPWWTRLSFHDHPPLFFIIQYFSFKLFGDSLFAARLPSALSGIASIYLVYLIFGLMFGTSDVRRTSDVQLLKNRQIAPLFAAFLLSINLIHIWISRSSLFESLQIFFILLNIYYFFRFLENRRYWWLFGLTLGLAFLTKYTSIFLIPVYFTYLFLNSISRTSDVHRTPDVQLLKDKHFHFAFLLALLLFSPVLVYNFYLWKITGHFDLQLAYLFNQATPEWRASLGKIQDPFSEIISNLTLMYSLPFLLAAISAILYSLWTSIKDIRVDPRLDQRKSASIFWLLNIIFITLMLVAVGSAFRFIVLYAPPAAMLIALFFDYLYSRFNKEILFRILTVIFLLYELFFGLDIFLTFPDFGIATLDRYFDVELGQKRSPAIPISPNSHLDTVIKTNALRLSVSEKPTVIVYDENVSLSARLWLFTRRNYYFGIPVFTVDQFKNFLKSSASQFTGYQVYFVKASKDTYLNPIFHSNSAEDLEGFLHQQFNLAPVKIIYGYDNLLMFTVYKFSL